MDSHSREHYRFQGRNRKGKFQPISNEYENSLSPERKAQIRRDAELRAQRDYRHISVKGVIYPNLTRAAEAVGVSQRALRTYAESDNPIFDHIFFTEKS